MVFRKICKLLLVLLWLLLIFSFSSDTGEVSTKKSDGFIIRSVEVILGRDLSDSEKKMWTNYLVVPVRKGAHVGIYLILGVLILSFIGEFVKIDCKVVLISVFICCLYAISDEIHQMMVPGRSGQLKDICLDTLGSKLGIIGSYILMKRIDKS